MYFATLESLLFVLTFLSATSSALAQQNGHGVARRVANIESKAVPKPESLDSKRRLMEKKSYSHEAEDLKATGRAEAVKRNQKSRQRAHEKKAPKAKRAASMTYNTNYGYTTTATNYATSVSTSLSPIVTTQVIYGKTTIKTIGTSTARATVTTDTSYGVSSSQLPYQTSAVYTTTFSSAVPTTLFTTKTSSSVGYATRTTSQVVCGLFNIACVTNYNTYLVPTATAYQTSTYATATQYVPSYSTSTGTVTYTYTPGPTPTGSTSNNGNDNCDGSNCPFYAPIAIRDPIFGYCVCV